MDLQTARCVILLPLSPGTYTPDIMSPPITMPWGKYKGELLEDVPSSYLLYTLENARDGGDRIFLRRLAQELTQRILKEHMPGANPDGSYGDPSAFRDAGAGPHARYQEPTPTSSTHPRATRAAAENIINAGFRVLAREHHPDKTGGSHDVMATLSDAVTRLRKFAVTL
jgi:uncharacterized protein (DUF3820 family)